MDEIAAAVSNTVFSFNAPLIWNFAEYIVKEAHRRGLRRVYFLARDGYEPYIFANRIADELGYALECRYLYASRLAWRLPAYALLSDEAVRRLLFSPSFDLTAGAVLDRIAVSPEEKKEILDLLGYAEECPLEENKILHEFSDKAWRCAFFRETLERNARRALGNTLLYFEQEGLLDGDFALCDSGWAGTMQDCLQAILGSTGKEIRVYGFYFGLFTGSAAGDSKNAFYFGPDGGLRKKLKFNNNLLETLLVSPDPLTVGYSESGCAVVPVFRLAGDDWFAEDHALLQEWLSSERKRRLISSGRKFSRRIKRVMYCPKREQLISFSRYYFSDDPAEREKRCLVRKMEKREAKQYLFFHRLMRKIKGEREKMPAVYWLYGSIAASDLRFKWWYRWNAYAWELLRAVKEKITRRNFYAKRGKEKQAAAFRHSTGL